MLLFIIFHTFPALEEGVSYAGYGALIVEHGLEVPAPDTLYAIGIQLEGAVQGNFVLLINGKIQYAAVPPDSKRHRIRNNLSGTRGFCPLI